MSRHAPLQRVAIVTGGASGIGLATGRALAARGVSVVLADIDFDAAERAAGSGSPGLDIHARRLDVADAASVTECVDDVARTFGRIDLLFNSAADTSAATVGRDSDIANLPEEVWLRTLEVNLTGAMRMCKACIPVMQANAYGSIVNMASVAALAGNVALTAYAASKAALVGMTRSVATQYGRDGVRCNAIAAGFIETPSTSAHMNPVMVDIARRNTLVGFLGAPDDVAEAAAFLLSDEARFITGHTLVVDGGQLAHVPTYDAVRQLDGGD